MYFYTVNWYKLTYALRRKSHSTKTYIYAKTQSFFIREEFISHLCEERRIFLQKEQEANYTSGLWRHTSPTNHSTTNHICS